MPNLARSAALGLDAFEADPIELNDFATEDDLQEVIAAVYKQVLGNVYVMDNQRLSSSEAKLRRGESTVREFVRQVGYSSLYSSLFFETSSAYQFIELSFKHFLGRAPQDQAEIAQHVAIYNESGYQAEIDSYLDSDEYVSAFGENLVPYYRGTSSQVGLSNASFGRMFSLLRGSATSDLGQGAKLITSVAANLPAEIKPLPSGSGLYGSTDKKYRISVSSSQGAARLNRVAKREYVVSFSQLNNMFKSIQRSGCKIVSITEIA